MATYSLHMAESAHSGYLVHRRDYIMALAAAILTGQLVTLATVTVSPAVVIISAGIIFLSAAVFAAPEVRLYVIIVLVAVAPYFFGIVFDTPEFTSTDTLPVFAWFAVVAMLGMVLQNPMNRAQFRFSTPLDAPIALFFLWSLVTVSWTPTLHAVYHVFLLACAILVYYLAVATMKSPDTHRRAINFLIVLCVAVAILSIGMLHTLERGFRWTYELADSIFVQCDFKYSETRAKSIMNPNRLGIFLNFALALCLGSLAWLKGATLQWRKLALFVASVVLVLGVMETKSKACLGAMLVMVSFLVVAIHALRKNLVRNASLCLTVFVGLFVVQSAMVSATPRVLSTGEMSLESRFRIWSSAWELLLSKSHGWGLGPGGLIYYTDPLPHAHSIYFAAIYDFGVPGLIFLMLLILILAIHLFAHLHRQDTYAQTILTACAGGLMAMAIAGLVDSSYEEPVIWLFLGMTMATLALVRNEIEHGSCDTTQELNPWRS